jgi:hypothetical protein
LEEVIEKRENNSRDVVFKKQDLRIKMQVWILDTEYLILKKQLTEIIKDIPCRAKGGKGRRK